MVIVPEGWSEIDDLVCGFGGRGDLPPPYRAAQVTQVHGNRIVDARDAVDAAEPIRADGLIADSMGLLATIRTADCVPVLLVAPRAAWAAVVHAGWRGTAADIAGAAVRRADSDGIAPGELWAAIGPAIGPCCYEVGEEVAVVFDEQNLAVDRTDIRPRLDLRAINRALLTAAGVATQRIQICGPCTRCRSDRYWSYRADGERAGRQLSWIGWEDRRQDKDP